MFATMILKCILLSKGQVLILEAPVNQYGTATISQVHNDAVFEATVVEERMNSVKISVPKYEAETLSYSYKDLAMRSLSTRLDIKNEHASLDCEINTVK